MSLNKERGFSIVEIALVLIIFGFVSSIVLFALRTYTEQARITRTQDSMENSLNIINAFKGETGFYPCPAPLTLGPNDSGYGFEVTDPVEHGFTPLQLDNNFSRIGRNDLDGDTVNEEYFFGSIPFNTIINDPILSLSSTADLNFSAADSLDGWGNKLVYIVSRHLCDPAYGTANGISGNPEGVLDVVTEAECTSENPDPARNGTQVPQSVLPGSCDGTDRRFAQFVLISHGETARGAYNENGFQAEDCIDISQELPTGDPGLGGLSNGDWFNNTASERKNCKYDRPDTAARNGEFFVGLRSEANDRSYYDDYIRFYYEDEYQIFASATSLIETLPDGTTVEISRMQSVNTGEIGIGLEDPEEVLHINGDMQAFDIEAEEFCSDIEDNLCMPVETLTSEGIRCPRPGQTGTAIQAIEENNTVCAEPFAGLTFTCSLPNERLKMVSSDGGFKCCDPAAAAGSPNSC